jgi:D-alanyl-D-alanine carboxypeptidase (penicillin-binding protein 5/6)
MAVTAFAVALLAVVASLTVANGVGATQTVSRTLTGETVKVRTPRAPTGLSMKSGTVIDAATGRALWSLRSRQQGLIASTTKIMTALVAIARSRPNQLLTATRYHPDSSESVLGLKPGERMTAGDLLKALLMVSANDAADTLAARLAGSRAAFVAAMNRRARALGLRATHYGNPVGLDKPRTVSTAHDLAKLAAVAMRDPRFRSIVGRKRATLRSGSRVRRIVNHNKLLIDYPYVDGVKTGHTLKAGYLLVGSAVKRDARVISVVMDEPSDRGRWGDSIKLLRFGREFFKPVRPVIAGRTLTRLPVALQDATAPVYAKRNIDFALRDGERYAAELTAVQELDGPLAAGSRVGTVAVTRDGRKFGETDVFLRSAVPAPPIQAVLLHQLQRILPALLLLTIMFMIGLLFLRRRARRRPRGIGEVAARPFPQ